MIHNSGLEKKTILFIEQCWLWAIFATMLNILELPLHSINQLNKGTQFENKSLEGSNMKILPEIYHFIFLL